jgi:hypothetical protein
MDSLVIILAAPQKRNRAGVPLALARLRLAGTACAHHPADLVLRKLDVNTEIARIGLYPSNRVVLANFD